MEDFDIHRVVPVRKTVVKDFQYDAGRWRQLVGADNLMRRFGGPLCVFDARGDVRVSDSRLDDKSKLYFTDFGPCFGHAAMRSLPCDEAYRTACRRLTAVRDNLEYHELLISNQREWCLSQDVRAYVTTLRSRVQLELDKLEGTEEDLQCIYAYAPREKRKIYIRAYEEAMNHYGGLYAHPDVVNPRLVVSHKDGEWSMDSKYDRNIVNFGPHASLVGGFLMDSVKDACTLEYLSHGCTAWFVKSPSGAKLQEAFTRLINCEHRIEYCYYSDDSCLAFRCKRTGGGHRIMFVNVDISACDGSNFQSVFDIAQEVMQCPRFSGAIRRTFAYLKMPLTFTTSDGRVTKLKPTCMRMYSGSVLTTFINNIANMLIFLSLSELLNIRFPSEDPTEEEFADLLGDAAERAGYKVTRSPASETPETLQFLKRSPSVIDGVVAPWLNLGTLLRGFGTIRGDLPGSSKTSLEKRARAHNAGIVLSRVHDGEHSISRAFRAACPDQPDLTRVKGEFHGGVGASSINIPDELLAVRYGLSPVDIARLASEISTLVVGQRLTSHVIDRIMSVDYGVEWR